MTAAQSNADYQPAPNRGAPKGGPLARLAGQLCQNPEFLDWFAHHLFGDEGKSLSATEAASIMRAICRVSTRAALDHNKPAADRFHNEIRKPWVEHQRHAKKPAA